MLPLSSPPAVTSTFPCVHYPSTGAVVAPWSIQHKTLAYARHLNTHHARPALNPESSSVARLGGFRQRTDRPFAFATDFRTPERLLVADVAYFSIGNQHRMTSLLGENIYTKRAWATVDDAICSTRAGSVKEFVYIVGTAGLPTATFAENEAAHAASTSRSRYRIHAPCPPAHQSGQVGAHGQSRYAEVHIPAAITTTNILLVASSDGHDHPDIATPYQIARMLAGSRYPDTASFNASPPR